MTTEHLKILLDSIECCALFGEVATLFVSGQIPPEILEGVRVENDRSAKAGWRSPGNRGRGCDAQVRSLAQQFGPQAEAASHPFQCALSTRAGHSVWHTWCRHWPVWTKEPCCPQTVLERMSRFLGKLCCEGWQTWLMVNAMLRDLDIVPLRTDGPRPVLACPFDHPKCQDEKQEK